MKVKVKVEVPVYTVHELGKDAWARAFKDWEREFAAEEPYTWAENVAASLERKLEAAGLGGFAARMTDGKFWVECNARDLLQWMDAGKQRWQPFHIYLGDLTAIGIDDDEYRRLNPNGHAYANRVDAVFNEHLQVIVDGRIDQPATDALRSTMQALLVEVGQELDFGESFIGWATEYQWLFTEDGDLYGTVDPEQPNVVWPSLNQPLIEGASYRLA